MLVSVLIALAMPVGDVALATPTLAFAQEANADPGSDPGPGSSNPAEDHSIAEPPVVGPPGTPNEDSPPSETPVDEVTADPAPTLVAPNQTAQDSAADLAALPPASLMSGVPLPDNSAPVGSGPIPLITSSMMPVGALASGGTRVFTVSYENEATTAATNARLWHQYMNRADHITNFTVSCTSEVNGVGGGSCPTWVPVGPQSIPNGIDHEYYRTFAGVFTMAPRQKLIFTVTVTSTFQAGICTETGSVMNGGWARYSATGFEVADIDGSASSVGTLTGAAICPEGDIKMVNTVTSPRPPGGAPQRVLSGDPRGFEVSWENIGSVTYSNVPISYTYYVPYTGQVTHASWTCAATGGATCPVVTPMSPVTVPHDNPGEEADTIFEGQVTLAPGQKVTFSVSLATTINTCTQDGYLRVQSYAHRNAIGTETQGRTKSSELVEIGCSTWMLDEDFSGTSISDPGWKGLEGACLTRAPNVPVTNGLGYCVNRVNSPRTAFESPVGTPKGFLQLTDDSNDKVGAALYNRALPSSDGLVVEFTTYQYGNAAAGADGIGFFLSDGAYNLTMPGDSGGALGYAYRVTGGGNIYNVNGLAHGYLGVGFDVYGNYVNSAHTAPGCAGSSPLRSQSVALRGPGNLRNGYCLVAQNQVSAAPLSKRLDYVSAGIATTNNTVYDNGVRNAVTTAKREVRLTIWPLQPGQINPRVTVEIDFNDGYFFRTILDEVMPAPVPALIKFGFLGATGGARQAHLLDAVRVGTVLPMKELSLTKVVDYENSSPLEADKIGFAVGDTVSYKFVVHNATSDEAAGFTDIYNIAVTDPLISSITCPKTTLLRFESMECTGSLTVTAAQRDAGRIPNTATAIGSIAPGTDSARNLSSRSSAQAVVNPEADDALRVITPGNTANFQVIKHGTTLGIVRPDDATRLKLEVWNGSSWVPAPTSGSTSVSATNGTWSVDPTNKVSFVQNGTNYSPATLRYRVTNLYGGWDEAVLTVNISVTSHLVCTPTERRASDRYWGFGTNAGLDFGTTGVTVSPRSSTGASGGQGAFVVTNSVGTLQFTVDGGANGRILDRTGALMSGGTLGALNGASPISVFPAGQGTGRFHVVTTNATSSAAGQLSSYLVDMGLNGGLGGVVGTATALGPAGVASSAVTAVPNADGTAYWVLNPQRGSNTIRAYLFNANGYTGTLRTSTPGNGAAANTVNHEDIVFNPLLTRVAALASNTNATGGAGTIRARLMSFDAVTGAVNLVGEQTSSPLVANTFGYSLDFTANGTFLYVSRIGTGTTAGRLYRAAVTDTALGAIGQLTNLTLSGSGLNGGAVRLGADNRLYLALNGNGSNIRVLGTPEATGTTTANLGWSTQSLAAGTNSGFGLSQTLVDCAIAPAKFFVEKFSSTGVRTAGAEFALYANQGGVPAPAPVATGVIPVPGQPGRFEAAGLAPGSYWLRETKAIAGHALLAEDVLIEVRLRGEILLDSLPNPQVELVSAAGVYTVKITDTKSVALPFAGGNWLMILTIGGTVVLLLMLAGTVFWRRRRNGDESPPDAVGGDLV